MHRQKSRAAAGVLAILWVLASGASAATPDDQDIFVRVQKNGAWIVVDVDVPVAATARETWNVMTDYDHMAQFVSNLISSYIIDREGNTLHVFQKGKAFRGPLTLSFENVREIELTPFSTVRSRLVSGDFEASEFTTRVVDHGATSQIINHGEFIPKIWVPPMIGPAMIEAETRQQFGELRNEILRRKAQGAARPQ